MDTKFFPIILIAFGVGFLLYNLGIIHFTPWEILWPSLIIWLGASQLRRIIKRGSASEDSAGVALWLIVVSVGFYLLLPTIGIAVPSLPRNIFWPLVLILIGILKLLPGGSDIIKFEYRPGDGDVEMRSSFVSEIKRGPNWVLDDLRLRQGVGSINLDLTQAMIPDREVTLDVSGYIGEAVIYLPPGLPFKAECSLNLGEITVLDHNESGSNKYIKIQSPNYETSKQRVNIRVHWKIGEVSIHQIR